MNIVKELEKLGIEITEEQKDSISKKFSEDVITLAEHEKKIAKVEMERDQVRAQFESAQETLKGFEGKDFDAMTAEVEKWKAQAEASEKEYAAQLQRRDYMDALSKRLEGIEFTSDLAKKAFMADLEANPLQLRDGNILGFDDYLKSMKESNPTAFVEESAKDAAKFTDPIGKIGDDVKQSTKTTADLRAVMGLPAETK